MDPLNVLVNVVGFQLERTEEEAENLLFPPFLCPVC